MGLISSKRLIVLLLSLLAIFVFVPPSQATKISGTISSTLTIVDDSELVGDVTCTVEGGGPCIVIGASNITLLLRGFTISTAPAACTPDTSFNDAIDVIGMSNVAIRGPGLVQAFGGFGIFLFNDSKIKVQQVTITDSCFSGIFLGATSDSDIEKNVSVRNSMGSENGPCGGT
jgi:hypothetical protein